MFLPMPGENTSEITQVLQAIKRGDSRASEELLPLVYDELRRLAAARMAQEAAGQTLQATALVHEAWLRLVEAATAPGKTAPIFSARPPRPCGASWLKTRGANPGSNAAAANSAGH